MGNRGHNITKKHRISTTISQKHWALLNRYTEQYRTHQKTLELALEGLEDSSKKNPSPSPEEEHWMSMFWLNSACILQKDYLRFLMEAAETKLHQEYVTQHKPLEFVIEYHYQKPLKECSLEEVIEGLVINARVSHLFDTVNYTDDGDHYTIKITHSMGHSTSVMLQLSYTSVFNTMGIKTEPTISDKTFFIKIRKRLNEPIVHDPAQVG